MTRLTSALQDEMDEIRVAEQDAQGRLEGLELHLNTFLAGDTLDTVLENLSCLPPYRLTGSPTGNAAAAAVSAAMTAANVAGVPAPTAGTKAGAVAEQPAPAPLLSNEGIERGDRTRGNYSCGCDGGYEIASEIAGKVSGRC